MTSTIVVRPKKKTNKIKPESPEDSNSISEFSFNIEAKTYFDDLQKAWNAAAK